MNDLDKILTDINERKQRLLTEPNREDAAWAVAEIDRLNATLGAFAEGARREAIRNEETISVLWAADDDIREHLQVARYNLTGMMHTGDQMPIPNPPQLIHQAGIDASDTVRAKIQAHVRALRSSG